MFIAHIPVGICLARGFTHRPLSWKVAITAAVGAIFPDLDLLRFYLIDNGQIHHHAYWTHLPTFWGVLIGLLCVAALMSKKIIPETIIIFLLGVISHLVLDSVAGDIRWLWPFSNNGFQFVRVPATHATWYMSFLHHWTFKLELFISVLALFMALSGHGYKNPKIPRANTSKAKTRRR